MSVINRRDVFRSSGMAVAATLANSVIPARAFAQSSAPSSSPMVSRDLITYLTNQAVPLAIKKMKNGPPNASDYALLASQQRLLAHHIESIPGYDDQVKGAASQLLASGGVQGIDTQSLLKAVINNALPQFKQFDSSITSGQLSNVLAPVLSIAQFNSGLTLMAKNGISGCFHGVADQLRYMSQTDGVISAKSPLHAKQSRGHIVRVGSTCGPSYSQKLAYEQCVNNVNAMAILVAVGAGSLGVICVIAGPCAAALAAVAAGGLTGIGLLIALDTLLTKQYCDPILL